MLHLVQQDTQGEKVGFMNIIQSHCQVLGSVMKGSQNFFEEFGESLAQAGRDGSEEPLRHCESLTGKRQSKDERGQALAKPSFEVV